jgi:hypothetical protein
MKVVEILKKVSEVIIVLGELLFALAVIYDSLTSRGILNLLSSWIGTYAGTVYNVLVLIALISLVLLVFWLGHRYYLSVSRFSERVRAWLKRTPVEPKENIKEVRGKPLEPVIVPRRELPPLEEFISKAKSDVIFLGLTLEVVRQRTDTILQLFRKPITMTFMVFNPDSQLLDTMKDAFAPKPSEAIRTTLGTLIEMKKRLSDVEKQRFEIRICDLVPVNSMICVDAGTEDAMIQVEQRLYKTEPRSRPCVIVTKKEHRELYYTYWNNYLAMKSKSKVVE